MKMWQLVTPVYSIALLGLLAPAWANAGDWPTFRGADRTAVSPETNLLQSWPEGGPPLVWKTEGTGRGYTTPAVVGDSMFLLGDEIADVGDKDEYLICLQRQDGKRVWATRLGAAWQEGKPTWQSSRSTPIDRAQRIDLLRCQDWRKEMEQEPVQGLWGQEGRQLGL